MKTKKSQNIGMAIVLIAIIVGVWYFTKKPKTETNTPANGQNQTTGGQNSGQKSASTDSWEGVLKTSDNPKKGNLMLVTKDRNIYMQTSRDFSALLNKEVVVHYEGNLQSFLLGDITAK